MPLRNTAPPSPEFCKPSPSKLEASAQPGGGGRNGRPQRPQQAVGAGVNSLQYADILRRIAEIEALKKSNIARTEAQTLKTKAQYQVNMVQWFMQRRYEHVLMAARFYNQIWKDGDATLRVNRGSDVAKLFSESVGVSPTVSSLDALSNEAIREVEKYVEAFDLLLSRDELHSASQRLMEAYALGEYLAPVATLPLEKKRRVLGYVRDLHELYGALQARDYTKTRELADQLKKSARDFPSSKVDSAIAAYTLASDLAIEEAKAHLLSRDNDKAAEKIRAAAEIWPTNPKLDEFRQLVSGASQLVMLRNDFDRLLFENNFREIHKRQYEFATAIQGDATREDAFRQIMENLMKIEAAIGKASEFSKMGQNYAAWEQLAEIREQFPDDPKLGRELELLAPQVADFTKALDRARQFENRTPKQTGSALSWYLKARSIHPQSKMAEQGMLRLTEEILPPESVSTITDPNSTNAD
jgi:Flp pilus assembly protein TadD